MRIKMHYSTADHRRGVLDGLYQAREIVRAQGWCYDSDRARASNAILGAARSVDMVKSS
jgi:hypothetical protein